MAESTLMVKVAWVYFLEPVFTFISSIIPKISITAVLSLSPDDVDRSLLLPARARLVLEFPIPD
jgi:hypothetical protein